MTDQHFVTVFLLLMLTFSITNGYISTLIMLRAIIDPSLEDHEVDVCAELLAILQHIY